MTPTPSEASPRPSSHLYPANRVSRNGLSRASPTPGPRPSASHISSHIPIPRRPWTSQSYTQRTTGKFHGKTWACTWSIASSLLAMVLRVAAELLFIMKLDPNDSCVRGLRSCCDESRRLRQRGMVEPAASWTPLTASQFRFETRNYFW